MERIARSYFQNIFTSEARGRDHHVLSGIDKCITEEDNQRLTAPYLLEEIREVVFVMRPTKALGEDGFPALFYQKCWYVVGNEVIIFCLQLLNEGKEIKHINHTHIVLIPKVANLFDMKQFR